MRVTKSSAICIIFAFIRVLPQRYLTMQVFCHFFLQKASWVRKTFTEINYALIRSNVINPIPLYDLLEGSINKLLHTKITSLCLDLLNIQFLTRLKAHRKQLRPKRSNNNETNSVLRPFRCLARIVIKNAQTCQHKLFIWKAINFLINFLKYLRSVDF